MKFPNFLGWSLMEAFPPHKQACLTISIADVPERWISAQLIARKAISDDGIIQMPVYNFEDVPWISIKAIKAEKDSNLQG